MSKGGARTRSGPAPDPAALRRDRDTGDWLTLPAEGRTGDPPAWPLTTATDREEALWAEHWRKPQAVAWGRFGQELEVALYVRRFAEAEERGSAVNLSTLVRQMADSLGLTTPGMRSNRWRIAVDEVAERREAATSAEPARPSARDRLRAIDGGSA